MLQNGQVDAITGLSSSSFINLKSMGVPVDDIVVMPMADYGVDLYGNVIMVSPKFAAENPDAVKGFLRAFLKGLKDTVKNPTAALDSVLKRNEEAQQAGRTRTAAMTIKDNILTPEVKANGYGGVDDGPACEGDRPDRAHLRIQEGQAEGGRCVRCIVPAARERAQGALIRLA